MEYRKRKRVFWTSAAVSFVLLAAVFSGILAVVARFADPKDVWVCGVMAALYAPLLAWIFADSVCRRRGLSQARRIEETFVPAGAATSPAGESTMALRMRAGLWIVSGVTSFAGAFVLLAAAIFSREWMPCEPLCLCAGVFALMAIGFLWASGNPSRFVTEVGSRGITQRSPVTGLTRRIPWSKVASFTIRSHTDVLGRYRGSVCTCCDSAGRVLHTVYLGSDVDPSDRERFLAWVRSQAGLTGVRAELVSAEAPAGLGTELEASQVPAGRGTEPEAALDPRREPARQAGAGGDTADGMDGRGWGWRSPADAFPWRLVGARDGSGAGGAGRWR